MANHGVQQKLTNMEFTLEVQYVIGDTAAQNVLLRKAAVVFFPSLLVEKLTMPVQPTYAKCLGVELLMRKMLPTFIGLPAAKNVHMKRVRATKQLIDC